LSHPSTLPSHLSAFLAARSSKGSSARYMRDASPLSDGGRKPALRRATGGLGSCSREECFGWPGGNSSSGSPLWSPWPLADRRRLQPRSKL
jgi:hypothetical protein